MDFLDSKYKCSICGYENNENLFWNHLIENHRKEIIQNFNQNNNKESVQVKDISKSLNLLSKNKINQNNSNKNNINIFKTLSPQKYGNQGLETIEITNHAMPSENSNYNNNSNSNKNIIISYCGKENELISCDCCPDHICQKGNCLCVDCMELNRKKYNLKNDELINKSGKIAKLFKGNFYCNKHYEAIIVNVIGRKFKKPSQCHYPSEPCDDCKVLNKFKDVYIKK